MRAIYRRITVLFILAGTGAPSTAQPVHPITLEVESGVHEFEIHKVDPNSVSVKLGASFKFNFSKNEVRSATSAVAGAAVSNARVLLNRSKNADPSNLTRLAEDMDRSAKELAALHEVYQWLIPEATSIWSEVNAAKGDLDSTRQALRAAEPLKRRIDQYLAQGYPFPEDWKDLFEKTHDAIAGIPIEGIRESLIDDLSEKYERFENLTVRQSDRSYTHIEDLKVEIEDLLASEKLTNGLWGQLRVRIDRALARIPEEGSRKAVAESLAPLKEEVEAFLDRNRERLALEEIEERLTGLESLETISAASAEALSLEVNLVATLLAGVQEPEIREGFAARLGSVKERLQIATSSQIEEAPTKPVSLPAPPSDASVRESTPDTSARGQSAAPPAAPAAPPPAPEEAPPFYTNRNVMIAGGAGLCVLMLLVLLRLLGKGRKKGEAPVAPRNVFQEAPSALLTVRTDPLSQEFSKPSRPVMEKPKTASQPPPDTTTSMFPDLPAIVEPAPTPTRPPIKPEEPPEDVPPAAPPEPPAEPESGEVDLDHYFSEPIPNEETLPSEHPEARAASDDSTPFPALEGEVTPSLESIFGDSPEYRTPEPARDEPEPKVDPGTPDVESPLEIQSAPDREEEPLPQEVHAQDSDSDPLRISGEALFDDIEKEREEESSAETSDEESGTHEPVQEDSKVFEPPQESGRTTTLVFEDMAAPIAKPTDISTEVEASPVEEVETPPAEAEETLPLPEESVVSPPTEPIELEPLVLEGQLVDLDGSESLLLSGGSYRLDVGIPFAGVSPVQLFPLEQAIGLVGESNGRLELTVLDRRVDGGLSQATVLLDSTDLFSICRRLGVYWVQDPKGASAFEFIDGKLNRVESKGAGKDLGRGSQGGARGLKHAYRPVCSIDDSVFFVQPGGWLAGYRLNEESDPRTVEPLWSFPAQGESRKLVSNAVPLGDRIAVVDSGKNLVLIEPSNGKVYWEGLLEDIYIPPTGPVTLTSIGNRLVYVAKAGETGMRVADFTGPGAPTSSHSILKCAKPALFGMDDGVLLVSESEIAFFEEHELALSWSQPVEGVEPIDLSVDRSQIAILVREKDGFTRVIVLGKNSGSVLWETEPDEADMTRIAGIVVQDGNLLLWGEAEKGEGVLRLLE